MIRRKIDMNPYTYPATYTGPYNNINSANNMMGNWQNPLYSNMPNTNTYSPQPQSVPSNSMTWVQGEAGAKSYYVAPGTSATLWDSEAQVIYLKSADSYGMPSMRVLDYTFRNPTNYSSTGAQTVVDSTAREVHPDKYANKDDVEALKSQMQSLQDVLTNLTNQQNINNKKNK